MNTYQQTIKEIIDNLNYADKAIIEELISYYNSELNGKLPILFVKNEGFHILARLALMISGETFVVVSTNMRNEEIISTFADYPNSIIITDDVENVKSKTSLFKTLEVVPDPIFSNSRSCNRYGEPTISIDKLEEYPEWRSILFNTERKPYIVSNDVFGLLYENLKENFAKHSLLKTSFIHGSSDDFFIYYLLNIQAIPFSGLGEIVHLDVYNMNNDKLDRLEKRYCNLLISYQTYLELWKETLSLTLQNKILFKWFFNKFIGRIIMFVIIRRFEKYFKRFKKIIVLGLITDPILAEISEKLRYLTVYNTYGETNTMMATGISNKPGSIDIIPGLKTASISLKENRKNYLILSSKELLSNANETSHLVLSFRSFNTLKSISSSSLFTVKDGLAKFLGYAFKNNVCPAYVESIFNSFPFIKESVLVFWKDQYILLLDIDEAILDANKINYEFFQKIMKGQVNKINKDVLPDAIQISKFAQVPSSIKRYNKLGLLDKEFLYKVEYLIYP